MSAVPTCWSCDAKTDDTTGMTVEPRATPQAGDVSVCLYCGALALFTGAGRLTREPSEAEHDALMADPEVVRIVGAVLVHNLVDDPDYTNGPVA